MASGGNSSSHLLRNGSFYPGRFKRLRISNKKSCRYQLREYYDFEEI